MEKESKDPFDRRAVSGTTYAAPQEPFQIESRHPLIKFLREGVQPPSRAYLALDDALQVSFANLSGSGTLNIRGRILLPDGTIVPFDQFIQVGVTRSFNFVTFSLAEGFLLSLTAGIPTSGTAEVSTYVQVSLKRGNPATLFGYDVLMAGYVGQNRLLAWPQYPGLRPLDGPGMLRSITGTTPAAGADISETVPVNARWRLISIRGSLTASASAGTRTPSWTLDDGANIYHKVPGGGTIGAGQTSTYEMCNMGAVSIQDPFQNFALMPENQLLAPGHRIRTATGGILAGDQWTAPQYLVQEWFEDQ